MRLCMVVRMVVHHLSGNNAAVIIKRFRVITGCFFAGFFFFTWCWKTNFKM